MYVVECADPPFNALVHQDGKGVSAELSRILNAGVNVLVFAGVSDLVCNHIGIERVLDRLQWDGSADWMASKPGVWLSGKLPAGYVKFAKNLKFLRGNL